MKRAATRLSFPNQSRSFDDSKSRVCFWGYDSAIEVSFFVETGALTQLCPDMSDVEAGFFQAFDAARDNFHEVANRIYVRDGKGVYSYILSARDF